MFARWRPLRCHAHVFLRGRRCACKDGCFSSMAPCLLLTPESTPSMRQRLALQQQVKQHAQVLMSIKDSWATASMHKLTDCRAVLSKPAACFFKRFGHSSGCKLYDCARMKSC
jgi:hypothetical protein